MSATHVCSYPRPGSWVRGDIGILPSPMHERDLRFLDLHEGSPDLFVVKQSVAIFSNIYKFSIKHPFSTNLEHEGIQGIHIDS